MKAGKHGLSRRRLLQQGLAAGGMTVLGPTAGVLADGSALEAMRQRMTAEQVSGPFYPVLKPLDRDADLTRVAGRDGRASGQVIEVAGRVVNLAGEPVVGARLELWQANAWGRYTHESDPNTAAPLDPNFQGYGVLESDKAGRYRFRTIMPGAYPVPSVVNSRGKRPPHIHFEISGRQDRLTTQLYFPGEALNETDSLFMSAGPERETLIGRLAPATEEMEEGSRLLLWDIVLANG